MKNIEKSVVNFVKGKGPIVSNDIICNYAAKNAKQADEVIDIFLMS